MILDEPGFLNRLAGGDPSGLQAVFAHFGLDIERAVARGLPRNLRARLCPADVRQVASWEFVLRVQQGACRFRSLADVRAMLLTIARAELLQQIRDQRRDVGRELSRLADDALSVAETAPAAASDPFRIAAARDEWETFLNSLPLSHQTIVQLRAHENTIPEIAEATKCSRRFVDKVLAAARQRLNAMRE